MGLIAVGTPSHQRIVGSGMMRSPKDDDSRKLWASRVKELLPSGKEPEIEMKKSHFSTGGITD
jgi:hypothetical protein